MISGVISLFLFTFPDAIARVFTRDEQTIEKIVYTLPAVGIYIILSGWQGVQSGNVRALG